MKLRLSLLFLFLAGVAHANDVELNTLGFEADALRQEFNSTSDRSRMIVILSPT
jgi:hypothetical protein